MRMYNSVISDDAAMQFQERLRRPDIEAIRQRDSFISDVRTTYDESGAFTVECDFDFDEMESGVIYDEITSHMKTSKENIYETFSIDLCQQEQCEAIVRSMNNTYNKLKNLYSGKTIKNAMTERQTYKPAQAFDKAS